jgi:ketosteroid isomerase-like protein
MSQENVEIARSIFAAWGRGDYSETEWAHADIEYVIADGPTPGSWTGLGGMAEGQRSFLSAWEDFRTEAEEYHDLDKERVFVIVRYGGRGKTSGLEIGQTGAKGAGVFHFQDRKVRKIVFYLDHEHALADLGIKE